MTLYLRAHRETRLSHFTPEKRLLTSGRNRKATLALKEYERPGISALPLRQMKITKTT